MTSADSARFWMERSIIGHRISLDVRAGQNAVEPARRGRRRHNALDKNRAGAGGHVYLEFPEDQQNLQRQLRTYFEELVAQVEGARSDEPTYIRYIRQMGRDGWLGLGWPVEYGGMARGPIDQIIFVEESHWAGVPLPLLTLNSVGPTIMSLGTDEQKQRLLPGILKGEVHFSIGYTEPSAGTDLASLKTRAVRDGDEYVINGQKIFTSAIQYADYVWLAARTDPDAPKHKGLSVFIVPLDTPGFHWTPLPTIAGDITSSTFYDDVRVPAANLVGGENQGWKLITNQLNHERVAICPASGLLRSLTEVRRWAQAHRLRDGRVVMDHEWVQVNLARAHAKIDVLKLFNWKVASASGKGLNPADASATKVYGTELSLEVYGLLLEVVGQAGYLTEGSPGAVLRGRLENQARSQTIFTFGGGTNEVQRDIVAMIGLGMPRAPR
jgi:3-oxocholest-4-en-26-oyl-CoA dehydrogenase alpha subunit